MAANQPGEPRIRERRLEVPMAANQRGEHRIRQGRRGAPMATNRPVEQRRIRDGRLEAPMNNQQSTEAMDEWVAGLLAEALAKNAFPNIYG